MRVEKKIRARVKRQMEKTQKEYYLNEQMAAIQKELGDRDDGRKNPQHRELPRRSFSPGEPPRKPHTFREEHVRVVDGRFGVLLRKRIHPGF